MSTGISSVGEGMVFVAFPLLSVSFTHNPALISGVAIAAQLPALIVSLPIGAVADRVNRRRLLVATEVTRFLVLVGFALIVVTGVDDLAIIYVAVFLLGSLTVVFEVSSSASLLAVVDKDQLVTANSHLQAADLISQDAVGQALGGSAFALAKYAPFVGEAASFALSAIFIGKAVPDNTPTERETTLRADLIEGLHWFFRDPVMRVLTGVIASLAFFQSVALAVLVLYGTQDLHLSKSGYGLLLGIASVGSVVGAAMAGRVHALIGSGGSIVLAGTLAAVSYPTLAVSNSPALAALVLGVESMAVVLGNIVGGVVRQITVPPEMMGRAGSAIRLCLFGSLPLGALVGGLSAAHVGVRHTMLIAGVLQMDALVLLAPRLITRMREHEAQADRLETTSQEG